MITSIRFFDFSDCGLGTCINLTTLIHTYYNSGVNLAKILE